MSAKPNTNTQTNFTAPDPSPPLIKTDTNTSAPQPIQTSNAPKDESPEAVITPTTSKGANILKKYGGKKALVTIFGVLFLVGSVATGVFLVQRQQLIPGRAWYCNQYVFDVNKNGSVSVRNGSTKSEPAQKADVFINDTKVATFDVPALKSGEAADLGNVDLSGSCAFKWRVVGSIDCQNSGEFKNEPSLNIEPFSFSWTGPPQLSHATVKFCDGNSSGKIDYSEPGDSTTASFEKELQSVEGFGGGCTKSQNRSCSPPPSPTPIPTQSPTPTPTPTPPPIGAACLDVKAYDTNWNTLTGHDLSNLSSGSIVRFAVSGTCTYGTFDKAKFTVNGVGLGETTDKKPGTDEFYSEYTIPEATVSFSVSAKIYHSILGWL
jgi:hypothetical protein